ncbi:MAG: DUF1588 domain-containing protein [Myxococcota bacterium]
MASTGGCKSDTVDPDGNVVDDPPAAEIVDPAPATIKKLRTFEYRNTIAGLLGDSITVTTDFRPDLVRANFSSLSAAVDCYDDIDVEAFEQAALEIAEQAFAASPTPLQAAGCEPSQATDSCVADFIRDFGRSAWRRPLTEDEIGKYVGVAGTMTGIFDGDVTKGVELTMATMLQSPYFLYRVELGDELADDPNTRKYSPYEMATRLAYTLWESGPDQFLLDAAENGELTTEESVREYATMMLEDPRANKPLQRFWREHLNIERLTLANYPKLGATDELYADMRLEGAYMAAMVSSPGADAMSFLTTDRAWLSPSLAEHYGIGASGGQAQETRLPDSRRGYLTSGVFLTTNSHPGKTSPTRRGKFVVERLMCTKLPPPPADVDLSLPEVEPGEATRRELMEMHSSDPSCSGCHIVLDPPGFAFEGFNDLGMAQELDNGLPVDPSGTFDGKDFDTAAEFIDLLRENAKVPRCVVRQAFRNTQGQLESNTQEPYIDTLTESFIANGHDFRALVIDIVSSEAFRFARGDSPTAPVDDEE